MKKVAMACGLVLVALLVADSIASYLAVRRVQSAVNGFSNLRAYPELNRSVKNQRPYEPSASDELTSSQLAQLLRVQEVVRARLGQRVPEISRKYEKFLRDDHVASAADVPALVAAYSDLAKALVDGKRAPRSPTSGYRRQAGPLAFGHVSDSARLGFASGLFAHCRG